jgi:hypothetical protein
MIKWLVLAALVTLWVTPVGAQSNFIQDGGFEAGNVGSPWTEINTTICSVAVCGPSFNTALPRTGDWWAWFGHNTSSSGVTQTVVIPSGGASLNFWLWIGLASGSDTLFVTLDGAQVWSVSENDPAYASGYTPVAVNVSAFADGGSHVLQFLFNDNSLAQTSNLSIDDISLTAGGQSAGPPCPAVFDGRINNDPSWDCAPPVAVYCSTDAAFDIYRINWETSRGWLILRVTQAQIDRVGVPSRANVTIARAQPRVGTNGLIVSRLTTGEFQVNTWWDDGKPYTIAWESCPARGVNHLAP